MRLTLGGFAAIILGIFLVLPMLPGSVHDNPLADPVTLARLVAQKPLPQPINDDHAEFHGETIIPPLIGELAMSPLGVLGANTADKRIEVDLSNQKVYAFEGDRKVYEFVVSTGKWAPTPTGEFTIWAKVRSQKMSGGDRALHTYYYLPNVPYVMFFSNNEIAKMRGFSLHGTYWHENFGHPMSHGCINMRTADAQVLYGWANPPVTDPKSWSTLADATNPGTKVVIYGITPKE
ncbi:hypothetical protein A2875_05580 [Candidatus Gottesmanbacteria bacterium RIFCSPHIGHO2_01_FULL_46_14]|uniref:L,D-TPase catalytic domain-containing protein n=2 Tax=Candidatus Gottesmaniibacteriota TaxID=1752720 RepID=A0A1F5ZKZ7_9BACT|nr:MAG: hypothetical protein A2875_05580 [Candidatus Gottesmanbacteria bacterium RIFCSPHIGHO2_01_FULL_46_14]OGG28645.1 MAG: hypothetical protein A2971_05305 [Candidatus Gottesmanbacteria bacterium RIFCSPLOWO2_01_FULL_46_21]